MYASTYAKLPREQIDEILLYNYDIWYEKLKDFQINDKFILPQNVHKIQLDKQEMQEIEKYYENHSTEFESSEVLCKLIDKLTNLMNQTENEEYFVRMSTRSPKDVTGGIRPCSNGKDVLRLLVSSNRISNDLQWYLVYEINTPLYIHLIPWRKCRNENELRCFIFKRKLVAITHYFLLKRFEIDVNIVLSIVQLCKTIEKALPYEHCVMDVEYAVDGLKIVEFNAYGKKGTTGAVLFDWAEDSDILNKSDPVNVIVRYQKNDEIEEVSYDVYSRFKDIQE